MRTIRVVLDTNVVVSAHLNSEGYERHVLDLALAGKIKLAVSARAFSQSMRECCGGLSFA